MRATAETMVELLVVIDCERRRLLPVKRTARLEFSPGTNHLDPPPDHIGQGQAATQLIQKTR